jgi:4-oxalomesaconate tautomerase
MMLVAPPRAGGALSVRSFIPKRVHDSIGVLAAVSVATAALLEGSPAAEAAVVGAGRRKVVSVEHPTGETTCVIGTDEAGNVLSAAMLRTARKLFDGTVFG